MTERDNTSKRSRNQWLTEAELEIIRQGYAARRRVRAVAIEIGCSMRNVNKYYAMLSHGLEIKAHRYAERRKRNEQHRTDQGPALPGSGSGGLCPADTDAG